VTGQLCGLERGLSSVWAARDRVPARLGGRWRTAGTGSCPAGPASWPPGSWHSPGSWDLVGVTQHMNIMTFMNISEAYKNNVCV